MAGRQGIKTKELGGLSVAGVILALKRANKDVLIPPDDNRRFDLAIYNNSREIDRVQCKTGHLVDGKISFRACSSSYHYRPKSGIVYGNKSYKGQAEYFGVYCIETGICYLVPVDSVGDREVSLRVDPPKITRKKVLDGRQILKLSQFLWMSCCVSAMILTSDNSVQVRICSV